MSERTRIRRLPERGVPAEAGEILAQGLVAHVGFCQAGQPVVLPFSYHYDPAVPDRLYLHGAPASRALRHLASGAPVCAEVTLLDGLVYSGMAEKHSMNYRSVVCFGHASKVVGEAAKKAILESMIARAFPGRTAGVHYEAPSSADLRRTLIVEVQIEEWSAKARRGGPKGPLDGDPESPWTSGVVEPSGQLATARPTAPAAQR